MIQGFSSPISIHVKIDGELHDIAIETKDMNVLELACATSQTKIAQYLFKDLNLIHKRDLNLKKPKMVHETMFLYVPILRKDISTLSVCFQQISLSNQEIKDLLWLMK